MRNLYQTTATTSSYNNAHHIHHQVPQQRQNYQNVPMKPLRGLIDTNSSDECLITSSTKLQSHTHLIDDVFERQTFSNNSLLPNRLGSSAMANTTASSLPTNAHTHTAPSLVQSSSPFYDHPSDEKASYQLRESQFQTARNVFLKNDPLNKAHNNADIAIGYQSHSFKYPSGQKLHHNAKLSSNSIPASNHHQSIC